MEISIKECTINDIDNVYQIGIDTFIEQWEELMPKSELDLCLKEYFNKDNIINDFILNNTIYFIITNNDKIAGFSKIINKDYERIELSKFYILKEYHGKGIAYKLMDYLIEYYKEKKVIELESYKYNDRANSFYKKYGFVKTRDCIFKVDLIEYEDEIYEKYL